MQRAIITAKGKVQKVGYRDFVEETADKQGITGYAENLEDGDVKIIAEGEKEVLNRFIELIQPKEDPLIKVREIKTKFEPATGEFKIFEIKYGKVSDETFERLKIAGFYLKQTAKGMELYRNENKEGNEKLFNGQNKMIGKQDKTIEIIKESTNEMRESRKENEIILRNFHQDTINRFDTVDVKYGKIAENMEKILQEMKEEREKSGSSMEKLINAILKLAEK